MIFKIARIFLDIKSKTLGIISFEDPKEELCKVLKEDNQKFKEAYNYLSLITSISKSTSTKIEEIKTALFYLNNFLEFLNFGNIFKPQEIEELFSKIKYNKDDKVNKFPKPKDLHFEILKKAHNIIIDKKIEKNIQNYIRHPRHQITESLIAFVLQKDI